jgi:uncharacterized protein (DUF1501 family)
MLINRRSLGLGALGTGLAAFATGAGAKTSRKFLVVHAEGGWDPLCVFAPMFDSKTIQMEPDAAPLTVGGFSLVDGPGRPSVKTFFERFGSRTLLVNGLSTRSVNHEVCQYVALTGTPSDSVADWPTLIALAAEKDHYLPHLVLAGPAFPGGHNVIVSRAEGRVQDTVHGTLIGAVEPLRTPPADAARALVDGYLGTRVEAFGALAGQVALAAQYQAAAGRARALTDAKDLVSFTPGTSVRELADNAIDFLANGVSRCATISTAPSGAAWDTHDDNSLQTGLFEALFADLAYIMDRLDATPAESGNLGAEVVLVVLSEMGRTPAYNSTQGRDHWPFTSALVIGAGVQGGRTIGGFTPLYGGIGADPKSGDLDPKRPGVDAKSFGATLLALADVDPLEHVAGAEVITGVLA